MLVGKSADGVAAMLGALAAGRAFCFLNTKYRGPQIAAILEASKSPICVVDAVGLVALRGAQRDIPRIAETTWIVLRPEDLTGIYADAAEALRQSAKVIFLGDEDAESAVAEPEPLDADRAAACLFTSGSTGEPKGVLIGAEDLMRRAEAEVLWFGLTSRDVLLSILPFSFDVGLNQLMTSLTVGGELVLLDSWLPADILAAIEKRRVTGVSAVPSIWQDMIGSKVAIDKSGKHESLRYITISGGGLPPEQIERLQHAAPGVEIFKTYGQTEAFRATSLRPEDLCRKPESVGRPFPGARIYVVREDGSPCAPGEVGEVVHTGLGIMMGYLNDSGDSAGTEAKRRRNPFFGEDDPSPFAVFTGDMGYVDDEGYLFLKGRRDSMLKVMGNRVYPQEVANQIVTIPGVRDATVIGEKGDMGQTTVIAFIAVGSGAELSAGAVRKALGAKLPAFMIPKVIHFVPSIPRTASGKADNHKLLQRHVDRHGRAAN